MCNYMHYVFYVVKEKLDLQKKPVFFVHHIIQPH